MSSLNVTYHDMQEAAKHLRHGEHDIKTHLHKLKKMVDHLVTGGYVTESSSKAFDHSYTEFNNGVHKMVEGLNGMAQYLDTAAKTFHETDHHLGQALKK